MAQQVADILGCDLAMANGLFDAAGGNIELAIELGFGGGGGGDMVEETSSGFATPYPHYRAIWPEATALPEAWRNQRLDSFWQEQIYSDALVVQDKNGPCGVLAVLQAELWLLAKLDAAKVLSSSEERLTKAVSIILNRILVAAKADKVTLADGTRVLLNDAAKSIRTASALVEAAASTAGIVAGSRTTPLVEGPHWLCSSDLMVLLLRGSLGGGGSFAAYDAMTQGKKAFYDNNMTNVIGMLSIMELDDKIPVADDLKFADQQVWVLHTGDHFVTMRQQQSKDDKPIVLEIYDGLKPNGPTTKCYEVSGDTSLSAKAPDKHIECFVKKRTGQADDLVQSRKADSLNYKDWTFEVVPAIDDPNVQGPLDEDSNETVYNFQELDLPTNNWRCATCYADRFKTMNFGTNSAGTTECEVCKGPIRIAMWSLWLPFANLTPRMKKRARRMYAPKLELILSTLYPTAEIHMRAEVNK